MSQVISAALDPTSEGLAYQDCINVNNISEIGRFDVPYLLNNTLYTIRLITADTAYNAQVDRTGGSLGGQPSCCANSRDGGGQPLRGCSVSLEG